MSIESGEFELIDRFISNLPKLHSKKNILLGPGDDAAHVRLHSQNMLVTTDMLIEHVHFRRDWMSDRQIGFKAMRVNISDIAAMGGAPRYAVISLGIPQKTKSQNIIQLMKGLTDAASQAGVEIIGGDTNAVPPSAPWVISVTVMGEHTRGRVLSRAGARDGDDIYVTGFLGESALGLHLLKKIGKIKKDMVSLSNHDIQKFIHRHFIPPNRVKIGQKLARLKGVHSMMDLSDGLVGDLGHILRASRVGAEIYTDKIPVTYEYRKTCQKLKLDPLRLALAGGEDYELLFTVSPRVKMPHKIDGIPLTKIGKIKKSHLNRFKIINSSGEEVKIKYLSYQHRF